MQTCGACGVEVEEGTERCPLCRAPLREGLAGLPPDTNRAVEPEVPASSVRRWLWEVVSLLAVTAIVIVSAIDLASGFDVSWSLYPISAVAFLWACTTAAIALGRRPVALLAGLAAALVAFLFILELLTTGRPWFVPLALPLVGVLVVMSAVTWAIVRRFLLPPLPAIAVVTLACGLAAVGAEYVLNRSLRSGATVSWSLVVLACALSLSLALLLVHKRLKERHSDIRRMFHL
jgi:uncharacterized membrane protein